ncbi:3'-5' exonuclease [Pseudoalteromonas gelatinilytica]
MDLNSYKYYMVVDLEATCCNDQSFPTTEMETIEIGAVMVCGETLKPVSEFCTFIKAVRHPQLTVFCTNLTSITQADVDSAQNFKQAFTEFKAWLSQYEDYLFCSWGEYDRNQFIQDCDYHDEPYPISAPHLNLKRQFSRAQKVRKHQGMAGAMKLTGMQLEGTHHRGLDDARNIARLLPFSLGRKFISQQK